MSSIKKIYAREIIDSRGKPTVEVEVTLEGGIIARAAVPSGASTGTYEAIELRDKDPNRYHGHGVLNAVNNVNTVIQGKIVGMEVTDQINIDKEMIKLDGTENKSKLGANAILGVSLVVARAAAYENRVSIYEHISKVYNFKIKKYKMPCPMFNVINGGMHSDSGLAIQEFKIIPHGIKSYREQLRAGSEVFHELKKLLSTQGYNVSVGDEGGFAPQLESNTRALELINKAITEAGYEAGREIGVGIDAAANSFYEERESKYMLKPENIALTRETLINIYNDWIEKYNLISIEDGLNENDFSGWRMMNEKFGAGVMLIGDDLLVTNVKRLRKAIEEKACNAALIKVNQIGTLTETIDCIKLAKKNKMKTVISHRSGETTDTFVSDLAVGSGSDFVKFGSLSRGERVGKYNRLLRIEEKI